MRLAGWLGPSSLDEGGDKQKLQVVDHNNADVLSRDAFVTVARANGLMSNNLGLSRVPYIR